MSESPDKFTAKNGTPDMSSPEAISEHFLRSEDQNWADTLQTNVAGQYFMSSECLGSICDVLQYR